MCIIHSITLSCFKYKLGFCISLSQPTKIYCYCLWENSQREPQRNEPLKLVLHKPTVLLAAFYLLSTLKCSKRTHSPRMLYVVPVFVSSSVLHHHHHHRFAKNWNLFSLHFSSLLYRKNKKNSLSILCSPFIHTLSKKTKDTRKMWKNRRVRGRKNYCQQKVYICHLVTVKEMGTTIIYRH